ncbi:hypothetical protein MASR2M78_18130 [Treponema sp.]
MGSWKFADDSDWWIVKSDGSFVSKKFTGSWIANNAIFTLYQNTKIEDEVRVASNGNRNWYYAASNGKLYMDSSPFLRLSGRSGFNGLFERIEYRDDMAAFIKVQVEFRVKPDKLIYRIYSNIADDYDEATGRGTWSAGPIVELIGNIAAIPSATVGEVYEMVISDITPKTPDFPDGTYTFLLYTPNALDIEPIGMMPFTSPAPTVYAAGFCVDGIDVEIPCYWLDGKRVYLAPLASGHNARVTDIIISGTDVYASGFCNNEADIQVAGYWKNGVWNTLSSIDTSKDSVANSICVRPGTGVHVGGYSTVTDGYKVPGHWWSSTWYDLPKSYVSQDGQVNSIYIDPPTGDLLFAGINTDSSGKSLPGYWYYEKALMGPPESSVWVSMDAAAGIDNYTINSLYVENSKVYACGFGLNGSAVSRGVYWIDGVSHGRNYQVQHRSIIVCRLASGK